MKRRVTALNAILLAVATLVSPAANADNETLLMLVMPIMVNN